MTLAATVMLFFLPIVMVFFVPVVALSLARHHPEPRYDKVVLRTILLICAASWAFTGVELGWFRALSSAKHVHNPGGPGGDYYGILVLAYLWILLGLPAIPLTVVSMIEYGKRRSIKGALLIPFAMMAICAVAAVLTTIWFEVFGR